MVNTAMEVKTVVETKMAAALEKVRTQMTRYKLEKARAEAEIAEIARMEIINARAVTPPHDPPAAPMTHINRITRFQPTDSRKPDIMDLDDTYGQFFTNRDKVLAFYQNAAIPENFSPKDQQIQFFDFVSPALAIQLRDRLEKRQDATWEQCVEEVGALMEIRYPKFWRRLEAFTITPSEPECQEYSRFIARQK